MAKKQRKAFTLQERAQMDEELMSQGLSPWVLRDSEGRPFKVNENGERVLLEGEEKDAALAKITGTQAKAALKKKKPKGKQTPA